MVTHRCKYLQKHWSSWRVSFAIWKISSSRKWSMTWPQTSSEQRAIRACRSLSKAHLIQNKTKSRPLARWTPEQVLKQLAVAQTRETPSTTSKKEGFSLYFTARPNKACNQTWSHSRFHSDHRLPKKGLQLSCKGGRVQASIQGSLVQEKASITSTWEDCYWNGKLAIRCMAIPLLVL